ncbi:hypothetical protein NX059_008294 [Plenodomus lindquistii]|nr:hypothetical protein NX059_008294 [Plenodomus lindquistii]
MHYTTAALVALLAGRSAAVVGDWQQCGGSNWSGETTCSSSAGCVKINDYYSQCQPGAAPQPSPEPAPAPQPTSIAGSPTPTSIPSSTGPGTTLQSGYLWIRAVTAPNYHKYLQSFPLYSPGPALISSYATAAQFQVISGQLVQLVSSPNSPVKLLYANVNETRVVNDMSLAVTFSETKNSYGSFAFGGDDLQWSVAGINRPNKSAWYVCEGQRLYVNLGNYLYGTPVGCADQTIHYYNDKTANN